MQLSCKECVLSLNVAVFSTNSEWMSYVTWYPTTRPYQSRYMIITVLPIGKRSGRRNALKHRQVAGEEFVSGHGSAEGNATITKCRHRLWWYCTAFPITQARMHVVQRSRVWLGNFLPDFVFYIFTTNGNISRPVWQFAVSLPSVSGECILHSTKRC